jgi:hypothetical protein
LGAAAAAHDQEVSGVQRDVVPLVASNVESVQRCGIQMLRLTRAGSTAARWLLLLAQGVVGLEVEPERRCAGGQGGGVARNESLRHPNSHALAEVSRALPS